MANCGRLPEDLVSQPKPFGAAKTYDSDGGPVHVALAAAFPTEAEARDELTCGLGDMPTYRGVWQLPQPYGAVVHVFTDAEPERLEAAGWAWAVNHPDCLCPGEIPHPERGMQPGAAADHQARRPAEQSTEV